jgi:hypothetical protein
MDRQEVRFHRLTYSTTLAALLQKCRQWLYIHSGGEDQCRVVHPARVVVKELSML